MAAAPPATVIPTSTIAPTSTHTPSPSLTPEPTSTRTPRPTHTPIPSVSFEDQPAESGYQVPLTVQRLTPFEATIHFELDKPSSGWLLYRPDTDELVGWWAVPLAKDEAIHQVHLAGLTPGITYSVQIGLGEDLESLRVPELFEANWGPISFMAPSLGEPDFRFGVVGDSGFGDDQTRELIELMNGYGLDFVLHTGDVVYKANEQSGPAEAFAVKYFKMFAPLMHRGPVFPVLGNHDFDRPAQMDGRPFFVRAFPALTDQSIPDNALGTWYAFERSGIQFIMLDSNAFHGGGGRAEQTEWLQERLADPNFRFSIPVLHTPPYTSGLHQDDGKALRFDWTPLFEAAGTPLVLSGHDHNYERILLDGVTYLVSGGGSSVLYRETERVEGSQTFHRKMHFVQVDIYQDHIELSAIDNSGNVLDQTTIRLSSG
jgi:predicted phosphodiesterase